MKFFLFVFIVFFFSKLLFAQHFDYKIITRNLRDVSIIDSTIQSETSESVFGYQWGKFYSNHDEFRLLNGNIIKVHSYSDTTILFEEFDSTKFLLSKGELVVDSSKYTILISDIPLTDDNGEPVIDVAGNWIFPADTSYYLVPNGLWYFYLDQTKNALVNYVKGIKQGFSYININSSCLIDTICISKILFDHGIEKSANIFLLPTQKELTKIIEGIWYHPMCLHDDRTWVFYRKMPISSPRDGIFSSTFIKNGNYEGKMNYSCGTGRSKEDYYQERKWKMDENGILKIGASKYLVLYLSNDTMILEEIE